MITVSALALRTGYGHPAFLLTIVTVLAQFAVLYSVSVAVGGVCATTSK